MEIKVIFGFSKQLNYPANQPLQLFCIIIALCSAGAHKCSEECKALYNNKQAGHPELRFRIFGEIS